MIALRSPSAGRRLWTLRWECWTWTSIRQSSRRGFTTWASRRTRDQVCAHLSSATMHLRVFNTCSAFWVTNWKRYKRIVSKLRVINCTRTCTACEQAQWWREWRPPIGTRTPTAACSTRSRPALATCSPSSWTEWLFSMCAPHPPMLLILLYSYSTTTTVLVCAMSAACVMNVCNFHKLPVEWIGSNSQCLPKCAPIGNSQSASSIDRSGTREELQAAVLLIINKVGCVRLKSKRPTAGCSAN